MWVKERQEIVMSVVWNTMGCECGGRSSTTQRKEGTGFNFASNMPQGHSRVDTGNLVTVFCMELGGRCMWERKQHQAAKGGQAVRLYSRRPGKPTSPDILSLNNGNTSDA